jgi:hypothetical protein
MQKVTQTPVIFFFGRIGAASLGVKFHTSDFQ